MGFHALRVLEHLKVYMRMDSGLWMGLVNLAEGRRPAGVEVVVGYTKNISEEMISELV